MIVSAGDRRAPSEARATGKDRPVLRLDRLRKEYRPGQPVLKDISIDFDTDGVTAIIGPSGTGKSTLIRCVNRLVDPTSGAIWFEGTDIAQVRGSALREVRRRIGMVFQEYNLVERLTVMENILSGRLGYVPLWRAYLRRFPEEDIVKAFELLDSVGLGADFANRRADKLSGGQRQRVGIARAIMQSPALVLADEPTSSLDPKTSVEIMELLAEISSRKVIPVIVNIHNVELARRYARRVIGMTGGNVVYDGNPEGLTAKHLSDIYGGEEWQ